MKQNVDVDLVDQFANFLRGGEPPGDIRLGKRPRKMTAVQSMAVIYILQEFVRCIPDCFEMCGECMRIYDTESEGHTTEDGKFYCDNCSYLCKCPTCTITDGERESV